MYIDYGAYLGLSLAYGPGRVAVSPLILIHAVFSKKNIWWFYTKDIARLETIGLNTRPRNVNVTAYVYLSKLWEY